MGRVCEPTGGNALKPLVWLVVQYRTMDGIQRLDECSAMLMAMPLLTRPTRVGIADEVDGARRYSDLGVAWGPQPRGEDAHALRHSPFTAP